VSWHGITRLLSTPGASRQIVSDKCQRARKPGSELTQMKRRSQEEEGGKRHNANVGDGFGSVKSLAKLIN